MHVWLHNYQIIFPASDIVAGKLWQLGKLWPHLLRMCRCLFVSTCFFLFIYYNHKQDFFGLDASAANANIISAPLAFLTLPPATQTGKRGGRLDWLPKVKPVSTSSCGDIAGVVSDRVRLLTFSPGLNKNNVPLTRCWPCQRSDRIWSGLCFYLVYEVLLYLVSRLTV